MSRLLREWKRIYNKVPTEIILAAKGCNYRKEYSTVSQNLMRNMGWKPNQGLGKLEQGRPDIIPPPKNGQTDGAGLGLKKQTSNRKDTKSTKAIVLSDEVIYGKADNQYFTKHHLNIKGKPEPTNVTILITQDQLRETILWNGGIAGVAESFFPNPKEWRLGDICKDLDKITVRDLTGALTRTHAKPPSCFKAWEMIFPDIHLREISERYSVGICTPRDFGSHLKLILHRGYWTNPHNPDATSPLCRLCKLTRESITHFGECPCLKPIFKSLRIIDKGNKWDDKLLNLMGQHTEEGMTSYPNELFPRATVGNHKVIPPGVSLIHFIVWKFIIIHMTKLSIKGTPFDPDEVLTQAKSRIAKKISSAKTGLTIAVTRAVAREKEPSVMAYKKWLRGIGIIVDNRYMVIDDLVIDWLT